MEKTWIAKFLPQDEYRQKRLLYFFAEATVILGGVLFVYSFLTSFISAMDVPGLAIALLSWLFIGTYITLRTTLTGIEYPDVATEKRFKKKRRAVYFSSSTFLVIFLVSNVIFKGIPTDLEQTLDLVIPTIFAATLFFILNYLALKKSYKKNKELLDD